MITIYKNGELHFKNKIYKCALGKNGIKKIKQEGDGSTPEGTYSLGPLYYRSDRIKKLKTYFNTVAIEENMFWSDDPQSEHYNKLIRFKDSSRSRFAINSRENSDLDSSVIPILIASLLPPEKEKAPMKIKGKKRLNKIACLFRKKILRKTPAK